MQAYIEAILQLATVYGFALLPIYELTESGVCSCPAGRPATPRESTQG
jgi:hypothetical protein